MVNGAATVIVDVRPDDEVRIHPQAREAANA